MMVSSQFSMGSLSSLNRTQMSRPDPSKKFKELDANSDGSLDKTEFETLTSEISSINGGQKSTGDMFSKIDSDGDGLITSSEFQSAKPPRMQPGGFDPSMIKGQSVGSSNFAENLFSELDSNQDNSLDKTELESMVSKISQDTGEAVSVDDLIKKIDSDGDSLISLDELQSNEPSRMEPAGPPPPPPSGEGGDISESAGSESDTSEITSSLKSLFENLTDDVDSETLDTATKLLNQLKKKKSKSSSKTTLSFASKYANNAYNKSLETFNNRQIS